MPHMVQKDKTPLDVSLFFNEEGLLQERVAVWMRDALGLEERIIRKTRFIKAARLAYHARTFYKTVWYLDPALETNATHRYTLRNWLNLIAHELYHRQEIGNNWLSAAGFGLSYGYHWAKNWMGGKHPYRDNPHEVRAFEMGCNFDSLVNQALERDKGYWEESSF